ncbi:response regulator [Paroceanicella profunda]|uniref:Response regulator n=1 Tax=Paroceanicella profunda TaxID=2579971 RepID=A0A5B8G1Q7_9RHOB|nr:response regulator [Paroceanicella profunda]QDL93042.1 response regulator [Paroceanicella profunda]
MNVLIVEHNADLGRIWARLLERCGFTVDLAVSQAEAVKLLRFTSYDVLVLQLVMPDGGAIAISDFATYRNPDVGIIAVSGERFFSDGSIFDIMPNVRSMLTTPFRPSDLEALVEHVMRTKLQEQPHRARA